MLFSWGMGTHAKLRQQQTATLSREDFVQQHDLTMLHGELNTAKPRHFQAMAVSQQEFRMWLVLRWAWEGRERRARTIPMPGLVCSVSTARSTVPGLLLPPLPSPISQQACHPSAFPGLHAWHKWHVFPHLL